MYKDNIEEQKKFFFYYYSKKKEDYVSVTGVHHRCITPCEINHPYYWTNIPFKIHNNFELRNDATAIGCFGCSFTFGSHMSEQETWPYILGKKIKKTCLNFGVPAVGIDSIFLNIKSCTKDYKFKKIIILLPGYNRRVARLYKNGIWFKWPVLPDHYTTWDNLLEPPCHIDLNINNDVFVALGKKVNQKIFKDENIVYSKKILERMIKFCKKNFNSVHLSSWDKEVYEYIEKYFPEHLLPFFDKNGPKAKDGTHPTIYQYNKFVENIYEKF